MECTSASANAFNGVVLVNCVAKCSGVFCVALLYWMAVFLRSGDVCLCIAMGLK